jgi:LPPG:FO 2-phospho-L-lactate transferase
MLAVLTGGTGGAKLVQGLSLELDPARLAVICNTGDDFVLHGLHIAPDLDTITYTLAGLSNAAKGWGIKDDSFVVLEWLARYGGESWFKLGDRDLALHITRTRLLREGATLSQVTDRLRRALEVKAAIMPMSDDRVETRVVTLEGEISFQEYFVKRHWTDEVKEIFFAGAEKSRPAPGVLEAIRSAEAVVICPSNPVTSIGPILAVPGIRSALAEGKAPVLAVSPIIGGAPVSGPAHRLMIAAGSEVSALGVAKLYADFLDKIIIASEDRELAGDIEALGIEALAAPIRMDSLEDKRRVAREVLASLR